MTEKPTKRRVQSGRVTPKGTHPDGYTPRSVAHTNYKTEKPSPAWVPVLMFGLMGLGIVVILLNYVGSLWTTNNGILMAGLGLILAGIITATQYR